MNQKLLPTSKDIDKLRPVPFYFITANNKSKLSYEAIYDSLSELKEAGYGALCYLTSLHVGLANMYECCMAPSGIR